MVIRLRYPIAVILIGIGLSVLLKSKSTPEESRVVHGKVIDETQKKDVRKLSNREVECLKKNVFYEAGIEPLEGKIAVAQVTLNRANHRRFAGNICDVVYAPKQFSWTLKKNIEKPAGPLWEETQDAVDRFLRGERIHALEHALFYHTDWIKPPSWAATRYKIMQVGQHIFYHTDRKA